MAQVPTPVRAAASSGGIAVQPFLLLPSRQLIVRLGKMGETDLPTADLLERVSQKITHRIPRRDRPP